MGMHHEPSVRLPLVGLFFRPLRSCFSGCCSPEPSLHIQVVFFDRMMPVLVTIFWYVPCTTGWRAPERGSRDTSTLIISKKWNKVLLVLGKGLKHTKQRAYVKYVGVLNFTSFPQCLKYPLDNVSRHLYLSLSSWFVSRSCHCLFCIVRLAKL